VVRKGECDAVPDRSSLGICIHVLARGSVAGSKAQRSGDRL